MSLSRTEKIELLELMLRSRLGDLREQSLIRQGKGWFHVSSMGHESMAAVALALRPEDFVCPYYRDRALVLGRGVSTLQMALDFFAKKQSTSGGRQMPGHFSSRPHNVWSLGSPVASNLLPACGIAWGIKMDQQPGVVVATCGDAATRQGDFYEAGSFAKELNLPMLFIIEDNGIGISSVTEHTTPWGLGLLKKDSWVHVDGSDVMAVHQAAQKAVTHIRGGGGPVFMWMKTERISSHSSADDQRKYRSSEVLDSLAEHCPLECYQQDLLASGDLDPSALASLRERLEKDIRQDYARAENSANPEASDLLSELYGEPVTPPPLTLDLGKGARLVDAVNGVFHEALNRSEDVVFFGQDIADPKGGVFSLTKGLSTRFPRQVFNSPLAESTILGVACGLASYGKRPVFEIQFVDFIWPGWNQMASNLATLRWRSHGDWKCPCVIYAPYGAYLPGGALWHSQTNEGIFAHTPGLKVCVPSTPEDAAGLFWSAIHGDDPVVILIPKHMLWRERPLPAPAQPVPIGKARIMNSGTDLSLVTWGNTSEIAEELLKEEVFASAVEWIDLRTVTPWDVQTVRNSVAKTGRLVVLQEDNEQCSVGQAILATLSADRSLWDCWRAPPLLVSKPDVHVGFNPVFEYTAVPDKEQARRALLQSLSQTGNARPSQADRPSAPANPPAPTPARTAPQDPAWSGKAILEAFSSAPSSAPRTRRREILVPLLGEGITHARVINLLKQPGDATEADDSICELETDKALFPVEAPFAGKFLEWAVAEEDQVEVGQVLAILESEDDSAPPPPVSTGETLRRTPEPELEESLAGPPTEGGLAPHIVSQMKHVVPTHMSMVAGWQAIRKAREAAKANAPGTAPSPTAMLAWCVVQAMKKHPIFCCTINARDALSTHREFDFGVAVSLQNDALDTAIVPKAGTLDWDRFNESYLRAVEQVRAGRPSSKARTPLILTSMGGYHVRFALPVVVPPAIATLFVGESHGDQGAAGEVVNLCLSFDHRWINGVAGAAFLSDVKRLMESFTL